MEILVTIIAFWLILVGAYGAYSLTRERGQPQAPRVREQRPVNLQTAVAGAGPFGPVSLPAERVPSFIARTTARAHVETFGDIDEQLALGEDESDRFAAEKIVAARLQARIEREEETEPVYEVPRPSMPQYVEPAEEPVRPAAQVEMPAPVQQEPVRPATRREDPKPQQPRRFELPARPRPTEVDVLRAQVQHLRSEIVAMSSDGEPVRQDRPRQRRYRTGNYTHLPRKLTRQMNEARGRLPNE
jgi:hypothetical protein